MARLLTLSFEDAVYHITAIRRWITVILSQLQ